MNISLNVQILSIIYVPLINSNNKFNNKKKKYISHEN